LNPSLPALIAEPRKRRPCLSTPVRFFMTARAVARRCGRNPATVACSVRMARFRARRSKPSVQASRELLPAAADRHHGKQCSHDWLRSAQTSALAWGLPWAAILASLFARVPLRTAIWIIALSWMGMACVLNAKRCGRTHCRYTGPYYLAMIAPVAALGSGVVSRRIYAWVVLAGFILPGSAVLWWASELAWGKYS
jgi:hypothetical protein